jgi:hypothetical protein
VVPIDAVYANVPFRSGEESTFNVSYLGFPVGYAWIRVMPAVAMNGSNYRVFTAEGKTGDWYRYAFVAHDQVQSIASPVDFAIHRFYLQQTEGSLFGPKIDQEKWFDFKHADCLVSEILQMSGQEKKASEFVLEAGATDVLSAVLNLRSKSFKLGKVERVLVYTSEKNWWLEAEPIVYETVQVPAGKFAAVKIKLQTFIGDELQQKGDVHIWIATDHPSHPLVKVEGEIKIGSVKMYLSKFSVGI